MSRTFVYVAALLFAFSACDDASGPGDDGGPGNGNPQQLPVLGSGNVTERYTAEIAVRDGWAYTTTWGFRGGSGRGNAVKIWDVSTNLPVLTDSIIVVDAGTLGDVQISADGRWLVVAIELGPQNGIVIYDLSNPTRPVLVRRHATNNTVPGVHTVKLAHINTRHYAFMSVNPGGTPAQLVVADITDPAAATDVLVRPMGSPFLHDVFVRDGVLFTALWNGGLSIWDIGGAGAGGSPTNPILLGNVQTFGGQVHNVWWYHDSNSGEKRYAFVGEEGPANLFSSSSGDVHVVDVSDFEDPREVALFSVAPTSTSTLQPAGTHNFSMDEQNGILYAAYYNGGVRALDVTGDLSACSAVERVPDGRCHLGLMGREVGRALNSGQISFIWGVHYQNGRVFASDMLTGIHVIDVSVLEP